MELEMKNQSMTKDEMIELASLIQDQKPEKDYDHKLKPADYRLADNSTQWFLYKDLAVRIETELQSINIMVFTDRGGPLGNNLLHEDFDAKKSYDTKK